MSYFAFVTYHLQEGMALYTYSGILETLKWPLSCSASEQFMMVVINAV